MRRNQNLAWLFIEESSKLLDQSMVKIAHCLEQLGEAQIWWRPQPELNSIGNLLLHLCGNLRQWTVVGIGGRADDRDRESEFTQQGGLTRGQLHQRLTATVNDAKKLFDSLDDSSLTEMRVIQGFEITVVAAITHTTSHFVGHTHQVIYLTRLMLGAAYQFQWEPTAPRKDVPI